MATGGNDITDFELYECQVCLEPMVDKNPRMLNCHHSFCEDCLCQIAEDSEICCPSCRKTTVVDDNNVTKLPMNFYIMKMWERETKAIKVDSREKHNCGLCEEGPATAKCEKCMILLCANCTVKHNNMRGYQSHVVAKLCQSHGHVVGQVCMKCLAPACISCIVENHKGHEDQLMEYQSCIAKVKKNIGHMGETVAGNKAKLLICSEDLEKKFKVTEEIKRKIEEEEKFHRAQLEKLMAIKDDIKNKYEHKKLDISSLLEEATDDCKKNEAEIKFLQTHIDTDPVNLIQGSFGLQSKVDETIEKVKAVLSLEYEAPQYERIILQLKNTSIMQCLQTEGAKGADVAPKVDVAGSVKHKTDIEGDVKPKKKDPSNKSCDTVVKTVEEFEKLGWPVDVAVAESGNVMVADRELKKVFQYDQCGRQVHVYNTVPNAGEVMGLTVYRDMLYIVHDSVIAKVPLVKKSRITAEFFEPDIKHMCRLLVVSQNTFVISDHDAKKVYMYNVKKKTTRVVADDLDRPTSISMVDTAHGKRFFITEMGAHQVTVFDEKWRYLTSFGGKGSGKGQFKSPQSTVVTPYGALLVADRYNHRISEFTLDGRFRRHLLTQKDNIKYPVGLAYAESRLCVLEYFYSNTEGKHIALRSYPM